mmetsp:Transcript_21844/g.49024  ORF Transcript_21844/g.49024 Transcript_21844/m.49024 type:complete len:114 (-) Transcript_21844:2925-3266(-)
MQKTSCEIKLSTMLSTKTGYIILLLSADPFNVLTLLLPMRVGTQLLQREEPMQKQGTEALTNHYCLKHPNLGWQMSQDPHSRDTDASKIQLESRQPHIQLSSSIHQLKAVSSV